MSRLFSSKWLQFYLPITAVLFWTVTIERVVVTDGGYDRLYGFPFAFKSNVFACSFCYEVYVAPLLLNLLIDLAVVVILFKIVGLDKKNYNSKRALSYLGFIIIFISLGCFCVMTSDSFFKFRNDTDFQLLSRHLAFFT